MILFLNIASAYMLSSSLRLKYTLSTGSLNNVNISRHLLNLSLEVVLEGRTHPLLLSELESLQIWICVKTNGVNGEIHPNGELVLDSLIDLFLDLVAQVLVLVGCAQHLVDLTVLAVQFLLVVRGTLGLSSVALLSLSPIKIEISRWLLIRSDRFPAVNHNSFLHMLVLLVGLPPINERKGE